MVSVLRLLGTGASGPILMALADGPLRTKSLTEQVPGYTPRTVYRYVDRLVEIGVIEREVARSVPSKVIHRLIDPCGVDLCELVTAYANASLDQLVGGGIGINSWHSLALLADLWELRMFEALNAGPCTATDLADAGHSLSFHQVTRRINLLVIGRFICEIEEEGRRRRYELSERARRGVALIAGLGRWRERHVLSLGEPGLTAAETVEMVRAVLPLILLPGDAGKCFEFAVSPELRNDGKGMVLWAEVEADGSVLGCVDTEVDADGWGRGQVKAWIDMLLLGSSSAFRVGGDCGPQIENGLRELQAALWSRPALDVDGATPRRNGNGAVPVEPGVGTR
jgi:DNA-binding HxlR family transcriptional regulator